MPVYHSVKSRLKTVPICHWNSSPNKLSLQQNLSFCHLAETKATISTLCYMKNLIHLYTNGEKKARPSCLQSTPLSSGLCPIKHMYSTNFSFSLYVLESRNHKSLWLMALMEYINSAAMPFSLFRGIEWLLDRPGVNHNIGYYTAFEFVLVISDNIPPGLKM